MPGVAMPAMTGDFVVVIGRSCCMSPPLCGCQGLHHSNMADTCQTSAIVMTLS